MKTGFKGRSGWLVPVIYLAAFCPSSYGGALQLVSSPDVSILPSSGGGGDSSTPLMTPDSRYVLFASTAYNLALVGGNPMPVQQPPRVNVYLRDLMAGTTTLVSVNLAGTGGGSGDSVPTAISTNGQFALFESTAPDLAPGDTNGVNDIFLRDVVNNTTTLVSVGTGGGSAMGSSHGSAMTPDGRYVVFSSVAPNLVPGDTNLISDVFIRDLQAATTTLVSVGAAPATAVVFDPTEPGDFETPSVTPDGRFVAFYSKATNLVAGVATPGELYVRDLLGGITYMASTNALAIVQANLGYTNEFSYNHALSADGMFVAFESSATNLTGTNAGVVLRHNLQTGITDILHTNAPVNPVPDQDLHAVDITPDGRFVAFVANGLGNIGTNTAIYLWDAQTGTNKLVSANTGGGVPAYGICSSPVVSPDGSAVAFVSTATNLTTYPLSGDYHLYRRDTVGNSTVLVDRSPSSVGVGVSPTLVPTMTPDGITLAYAASGDTLDAHDHNRRFDVFVRNLTVLPSTLVSVRQPSLPSQSGNGFSMLQPNAVSSDGRYVTFASEAEDLVGNDTNGLRDVFVRDRVAGTTVLVSVATNGYSSRTGPSWQPTISTNGMLVAFTSKAYDLVAAGSNGFEEVFVRNLVAGTNSMVSVALDGVTPGNGDSSSPQISADGRYVMFVSTARSLTADANAGGLNLFLRDLAGQTTYQLTESATLGNGGVLYATMSGDGGRIAYVGTIGALSYRLYVWNSASASRIYTNATSPGIVLAVISPDGKRLAYGSTSVSNVLDLATQTSWLIGAGGKTGGHGVPQFSADGRFLTYVTRTPLAADDTNVFNDVYLYDLQAGTNILVSRSFSSLNAANAPSDNSIISADGRWVAYRSFGSNNVPGDLNGFPDLFLYDRLSGATTLVSQNRAGTGTADHWSVNPVFSGDGQTLVFQSAAADLASLDFNQTEDIFALSLAPPAFTDTDGDGMDDQWEMDHFHALARDGTGDFDGDGVSDLAEYLAGTDPTDPNSVFRAAIVPGSLAGGSPALSWAVAPGRTYQVQFKNDLGDANWQTVAGNVVIVGGVGYVDDVQPAAGQRYYRIVVSWTASP